MSAVACIQYLLLHYHSPFHRITSEAVRDALDNDPIPFSGNLESDVDSLENWLQQCVHDLAPPAQEPSIKHGSQPHGSQKIFVRARGSVKGLKGLGALNMQSQTN